MRLLAHVIVFGLAAPFSGGFFLFLTFYLGEGDKPFFEVVLFSLATAAIGVVFFSLLFIPLSVLIYLSYLVLNLYTLGYGKSLPLFLGMFWGCATAIFFFPVFIELEINLAMALIIGASVGLGAGYAVRPIWKPL